MFVVRIVWIESKLIGESPIGFVGSEESSLHALWRIGVSWWTGQLELSWKSGIFGKSE